MGLNSLDSELGRDIWRAESEAKLPLRVNAHINAVQFPSRPRVYV